MRRCPIHWRLYLDQPSIGSTQPLDQAEPLPPPKPYAKMHRAPWPDSQSTRPSNAPYDGSALIADPIHKYVSFTVPF